MKIPKLTGNIVRSYLKKLGLTQSKSGITAAEFMDGAGVERDEIHRYIVALRRLAKT